MNSGIVVQINHDNDLIVPVYINQRIVFDLVATLRDGISTVTHISESAADEKHRGIEAGGSFGLGAALTNFIKVDLQGKRQSADTSSSDHRKTEERYHTPTSLFARLLRELRETGRLTTISEDWNSMKAGQLVEIEADLRVNPILEMCESAASALKFAIGFQSPSPNQLAPKSGKGHSKPLNQQSENPAEFALRILEGIAKSIRESRTIDLLASGLRSQIRGVITIEQEFLSDPSMADLIDGRFRIVGKVSRVVSEQSQSINLLRNSSFGKFNKQLLDQMLSAFEHIRPHIEIPDAQTRVSGPAIQMIPIAIYV